MQKEQPESWVKKCAKEFGVNEVEITRIYQQAMRKIRFYLLVNKQIRYDWQEMMRVLFEERACKKDNFSNDY